MVDADLKDFFGSLDHDKLLAPVKQRVSDGRVLGLIKQCLKAGCVAERKLISLIPSLTLRHDTSVKAAYGKTVRAV